MNKRTIAKIIVAAMDFKEKSEFNEMINFLKVCQFHTKNEKKSNDIQYAIWYLLDLKKRLGII